MWFRKINKFIEINKVNFTLGFKNHETLKTQYTKREFEELLFENCFDCKMSAIPQGAFATRNVRQNNKLILNSKTENKEEGKSFFYSKCVPEGMELTPLQYNSKLMNSIWGLYNRYSKHNFKKIIEANGEAVTAACGVVFPNNPPTSVLANKAAVKNS